MDFADCFWLTLLVAAALFELGAAIWKSEWTFSRHVWKWFAIGVNWKEKFAALRWVILAGLLVSTLLHFLVFASWIPIVVFFLGGVWSVIYHYTREA